MELRLFYCNTHAGQAIREGGIAWALERFNPDVTVLVEVGRLSARARMVKLFGLKKHSITGLLPVRGLLVESGTHVIAKRSVLKRKLWTNHWITGQRFVNGHRDKWHPIRRATRAVFVFRDKPSVEIEIAADHAWTIAGFPIHGEAVVPSEHRRQIQRFAHDSDKAIRSGRHVLRAGDYNENVEDSTSYVRNAMAEAHMRKLVANHLDGIFGSGKVRCFSVHVLPKRKLHTDHDGIVIDVEIVN